MHMVIFDKITSIINTVIFKKYLALKYIDI